MISLHSGRFVRAALLGGVCMAAFAMPALAQASDQIETVVVTGIRGSLQRSLDIKRESLGLTDAITMEDIGKFPDSNLASALMRIPGVTVTRAALGNGGAITTGQPTQMTVRGFGPAFNETLFDGRVIPSAIGGRSFDFSGLSADMVSALEVYKSPDPGLSAGAIGATVNVKYPKPFDYPGLKVAAAVSSSYVPDDGRFTPNGNFLVSDTFAGGKLGVLIAGAYSSLSVTQESYRNWGWIGQYIQPCQRAGAPACGTGGAANNTTDNAHPIWFTQDYAIYHDQTKSEQKNLRAVVQYQPTEALLVTVDGNYARSSVHQKEWVYAIWNNLGEMSNIQTSKYGTVTSYVRHAPTDFDANENFSVQQTYDVGINVKYDVNSHLTLRADYDQALSSLNPENHISGMGEDLGYGGSQAPCTLQADPSLWSQTANPNCPAASYTPNYSMNVGVVQPGDHKLPYYTGIGPNGDLTRFLDTTIMGSHVMVVTAQRNRTLVNQAKLEGEWADENVTLKMGAQYVTNHMKNQGYNDFAGNRWQIYSGYGPDSNNIFYQGMKHVYQQSTDGTVDASGVFTPNTIYVDRWVPSNWNWNNTTHSFDAPSPIIANQGLPAGVHIPQSFFTGTIKLHGIPGWTSVSSIPGLPKFDAFAVYKYLGDLGVPTSGTSIPGFNWYCCGQPTSYTGTDVNAMMVKDPNGFQTVFEDSYSFYTSVKTDTHFLGLPLRIFAGMRYEYTDVEAGGIGRPLSNMVIDAADHTAYDFTYGDSAEIKQTNSYQYLLPNLDLTLQATDDLQFRVDASRTLTRPPLGNMTAITTYGGRTGSLTANGGNPQLLPFLSDNLDVSSEWYYAPNSYVSADAFLKNVTNFVINGTKQIVLNNVIDPYTNQPARFALTTTINGPKANVYGLELAWQHVFGESGFGYQLNGTIVQTDKQYDPTDLTSSAFGVPGLADSFNAVVFYDKDGFEVRFAANWRDTYLDHFGQSQNGTSFGIEPTYVNTAWALDASTSYDITENLNVYLEVTNLLDQAFSTRGRWPDQVVDVIPYGRRFTAGVHFKM